MGSADADVVEAAVDPRGDLAVGVDAVVPDAVVGVVACGGGGFGAGLVGHGRGGPAGQGPVVMMRRALDIPRPCWSGDAYVLRDAMPMS